MKPIPAIVAGEVDAAIRARHLDAVRSAQRAIVEAESHETKAVERLASARDVAARARVQLGKALAAARALWPSSGRNAGGWKVFLDELRIDKDVAADAIRYAGFAGDVPTNARMPSMRDAGIDRRPREDDEDDEDDDGQTGPRIIPLGSGAGAAPFRQLSKEEVARAMTALAPEDRKWVLKSGKVNLQGNSGEVERGTWTTSAKWAKAIGPVDHDPFSNPRSLIASTTRCMLEDGGDGFGDGEPGETPGLYLLGERHGSRTGVATSETTTFFQWPYTPGFAERAIAHYGHTRFRALLRWSPDTAWFRMLWPLVSTIAIPQERIDFDPPPGVKQPESTISYPHALYYRDWRDVTEEVRALCIVIPIDHTITDPRAIQPAFGL